ncbi:photosystem II q(b) protein [Cylindrospermopsis raciborskii C04]|uniref:Photosystem II protein D1 n=2 Tax=Cylindrospermopsis raciborskii TaxID=77022 RepID=A0ABX4WM74_9CYAN|nr:photosystem II q(b) protein [Cylindrospermopsis raciborskii C03]PNJ95860.1 photosystem II q(b) protein [Cylindrospermopsis raciborskii C04]PNJ99018.1 photosystem II q(b) protein [Cylindrospermopsis raciborskii C07]
MKNKNEDFINNEEHEKKHDKTEYSFNFKAVGVLLVIIAASAFALKGIFVKLAFGEGISVIALLLLRNAISAPLFWLGFLAVQRRNNIPIKPKHLIECFLTGFLYFLSILTDLTGISLLDVSVERVIFFTYPAMILIFTAIASRKLPAKNHLGAFIITYIGISIIVGITSKWSIFINNLEGSVWAIMAASSYALYLIKSQSIIKSIGSIKFTTISNTFTFLCLCIYSLCLGVWPEFNFNFNEYYYTTIIAVFCTVIPFFILFEGIKRIGSSQSAIISMIGPAITLLAAHTILNEQLEINQFIGVVITILGIFMIIGDNILNTAWENLYKKFNRNHKSMTATLHLWQSNNTWERFYNWITSTNNRLYIGWFGVLMIPTLLVATTCFIIAFIAAPPVDIDGMREPVAGSLLYRNNIISGAVVPSSNAIGLHFYPIWEAASLDEWLYNGGPYQLVIFHFLIGVLCYLGREWELSYRLGMHPWICIAFSAPVAAAIAVFLIYPVCQGCFCDGIPLGISGTFNFMIIFQAEHNILMHPFHMLGVAGVFAGSFFSAIHGSLVTSSLVRESTVNESRNNGYRFGHEEEVYNIVAAHSYFGRLIFRYVTFNNSRSLHFWLAAWPVIGIWFATLAITTMAFNLNGFNFNQSVIDSTGRVISTWADVIDRANLGIEVMHEPNAQDFPLDLSTGVVIPVAFRDRKN